jgi:hypothetical protein
MPRWRRLPSSYAGTGASAAISASRLSASQNAAGMSSVIDVALARICSGKLEP